MIMSITSSVILMTLDANARKLSQEVAIAFCSEYDCLLNSRFTSSDAAMSNSLVLRVRNGLRIGIMVAEFLVCVFVVGVKFLADSPGELFINTETGVIS